MWNSHTVMSRNIRKPRNASPLAPLSFKWNNKKKLLAQLFLNGTNCHAYDDFLVKNTSSNHEHSGLPKFLALYSKL